MTKDPANMEEARDDDPFALIEEGKTFQAAKNNWGAASMYSRASKCLRIRADKLSSQPPGSTKTKLEERRKIISLYRAQSLEYLYKARYCLIEALQFENDQDKKRTLKVAKSGKGQLDPTCSIITSDESEMRRNIFQTLFLAQGDDEVKVNEAYDESGKKELMNRHSDRLQESLEARLAKLNASLAENDDNLTKVPPSFASASGCRGIDKRRLKDLQLGLKRLGVSLPDNSRSKDLITENFSDEDQIKFISQQARDEVWIENGNDVDKTAESSNVVLDHINDNDGDGIDENDSMFDGFEDEDDDIESLLAKSENLVAKTTSEISKVGAGNSCSPSPKLELFQLQKAQALLLEARLFLEMDDTKNCNGNTKDEVNHKSNSARVRAKERIVDADKCLKEILSHWR